jgi:dTDP-4-amino-4,6-dideoxygalactose transaminase
MHVFGHPCDLEGLLKLSKDFNLTLVEDAAESLGSLYYGRHTGTIGLIGALSFNGNKIITTGGGGAILTDDDHLAAFAKHITTTGKISHPWRYTHDCVAYNYRLPNINAALGCAQLEKIDEFISSKRAIYSRYEGVFSKIKNVNLIKEPKGCRSNYWLQALNLNQSEPIFRDKLLEASNSSKLMMRPFWDPIDSLAPYTECPRMDLSNSQSFFKKIVNIPSSANL